MLNTRNKHSATSWMSSPFFVGLAAVILGGAIGLLTTFSKQAHLHQIVIALAIAMSVFAMMVLRQARRILLIAVLFAIPLNAFSILPFNDSFPYNPSGAPPGILIRLYDFPLIALLGYTIIKSATKKITVRFHALDFTALLLIFWGLMTIYNATYPEFTFFEFLRMLKLYILARLIYMNIQNEDDLRIVIGAILAGVILQALISFAQYITNNDFGLGLFTVSELRRVTGTLGWPNTLGAYGATILLLSLALWVTSQGGKWIWLINLAGFSLVILSYSRGAWISLVAGGVIVAWLCLVKQKLDGRKILTRIFSVLLIAMIIVMLFSDSIMARMENLSPQMEVLVTRTKLNEIAFNMISAHPVLGVGQNNFMQVIRSYDTTGVTRYNMEPAHNVFLLIAAETGFIGLAIFLWLLGVALVTCWRVMQNSDGLLSATAIGLIGAILALSFTNIMDVHLKSDGLFALFWCLLSLVMAIDNLASQRAQKQNGNTLTPLVLVTSK